MRPACIVVFTEGLLACFLLFHPPAVLAQSREVARLNSSIGSQQGHGLKAADTAYVDTLNALAHAFYGINADSAFAYSKKAMEYAGRIHYPEGEAESWRMLGNTYELIGDYTNMLSSYHRSLSIAERLGNTRQIERANINIALFYKQVGDYDKARELMEKVSDLCKKSGDTIQSAYVYSHLSDLAIRQQQYDKALEYSRHALRIAISANDVSDIASFKDEIGKILAAKGSYEESIDHYRQSLDHYQQVNDKLGITVTTTLMAQSYLFLKDYPRALQYAQESMTDARSTHRKKEIGEAAKVLSDIYVAKGDDHKALYYFRLYRDYSDSLFNDQTRRQIFALAAKYEYDQKEAQLKEEDTKKDELHQQALRKDTFLIITAVLLIVFLTLLAVILLRGRRVNERANQLLREKNAKIEEQKEAMEHQAVQLLLNNQQKDKLFSIIAHDLRGPLNSLKGLLDFLKEKKLSEQEIASMMNELRRNVDYSSELVGNLLFWASSQLNGIVVTPVVLPLQPTVSGILALYAQPAKEKQVLLQDEITPSLHGYADVDMVQVVLRNLLSNAIKFCRAGDRVTVSVYPLIDEIEICVADTGIGIKEEVLEKIRGSESVTSYGTAREKGTGLGMLLCREFTEANKGRFRIESEWGNGCRCYFTIPAATNG
ncbi:MAG TPA: tetratricopeptide repeat-containing sensor histidine kinase [Puia sp.]|jgi:signal transduction histidine kinase